MGYQAGQGPIVSLHIKTHYMRGKEIVRINSAGSATNAVPLAVKHMRSNIYEARVAEVFDSITGNLLAVLTRDVRGYTRIVYEYEFKEGE